MVGTLWIGPSAAKSDSEVGVTTEPHVPLALGGDVASHLPQENECHTIPVAE